MKKCVNPACLAEFAFDDSMTSCPFCHSPLESWGGTDAPPLVPPLVPPLEYGIPQSGPAEEKPFVRRHLGRMECHGRVSEIDRQEVFFGSTLKLFNTLFRGEPYQLSHQTIEYTIRVEPITDGLPAEVTDFCLYGSFLGRLQVGDEVAIQARDRGDRRVATQIYNQTTGSVVRPGFQIGAGLIRGMAAFLTLVLVWLVWGAVELVRSGALLALAAGLVSALMPLLICLAGLWIMAGSILPRRKRRR